MVGAQRDGEHRDTHRSMHVYRWDLDKTYLATDIHSVRGMVRAAFERADEKRNVPGAPTLLRALLEHDPSARADILSGSPVQMRPVLEEKLALDGIRYDSLILKDNLRNLTRGRFRAVRGQVGYKLPNLLSQRLTRPQRTTESLFGDDAEVDALVYALYADAVAGRLDTDTLIAVMRAADAYDDQIRFAVRSMERLPHHEAVEGIYIHVDRGLPQGHYDHLGGLVSVVHSWFQAALALCARGRLAPAGVSAVLATCQEQQPDLDRPRVLALIQDAVRRGLVDGEAVLDWTLQHDDPSLAEPASRVVSWLGSTRRRRPAHTARDWHGFLEAAHGFSG